MKSSPTPVSSPIPAFTPTPTIIPYTISLINSPDEITEGDLAPFTWSISGPAKTIHSTTIYYGQVSSSAVLGNQVLPTDTRYTNVVKDFIKGDYLVPLQFIANEKFTFPGTYYFRAYALIDSDNYWTEEHTLIVKPAPKNEIKVVNYPSEISQGENASFTWEIDGPSDETHFTAIVAGKEPKQGVLDTPVTIDMTPYKVIVTDFTSGTSHVPLRFIGNTRISDPGVYYFRAVALINGKNIWSDQYSFTVK